MQSELKKEERKKIVRQITILGMVAIFVIIVMFIVLILKPFG